MAVVFVFLLWAPVLFRFVLVCLSCDCDLIFVGSNIVVNVLVIHVHFFLANKNRGLQKMFAAAVWVSSFCFKISFVWVFVCIYILACFHPFLGSDYAA